MSLDVSQLNVCFQLQQKFVAPLQDFRVTSFPNLLFTSFLIPFEQPMEHFDKTRPHLFLKEYIYFSIFLYKAQRECCYCAFHKVQALGSFTFLWCMQRAPNLWIKDFKCLVI